MARAALVAIVVDPQAVQRAERVFDLLTGVPISPDRKEAMYRAAVMDGATIAGRPVRLANGSGDLDPQGGARGGC